MNFKALLTGMQCVGILLAAQTAAIAGNASLATVTQPLWYLGDAQEGQEITFAQVPKKMMHGSAADFIALMASPTKLDGAGQDTNLISIYGIALKTETEVSGRAKRVIIDISSASAPEGYPFSVDQVARAVSKCVRAEFKDAKQTSVVLIEKEGGGARDFEPVPPKALVASEPQTPAPVVYSISVGEDATSTFHYFFHSNGLSIERVRSIWNGGAQKDPEVTEYRLEGSRLKVTEFRGSRDLIPDLISGKEPDLTITRQYTLETGRSDRMLTTEDGKPLTSAQLTDISNLIQLLRGELIKAMAER